MLNCKTASPKINDMNRLKKKIELRSYLFALLCSVIILDSCNSSNNYPEIPKEFKSFIIQTTTPIKYKEIVPYHGDKQMPIPDFITEKEALADIEMLEYLINTSYSGLEYWKHKGVDFESYFTNLRDFITEKDTVLTYKFEIELSKILKQIFDGHISFVGTGYNMAYKHKAIYYSDILVEKIYNNLYKVIDSQNSMVNAGDIFTQKDKKEYLFKTLSPTGKNHYLIGVLSFDVITSKELSFNDTTIRIPFHKSRLMYAKFNDPEPFYIERKSNISIVRVNSFADRLYPEMKKFMNSGIDLKNEKRIILNLFNNGGGSSVFPQTFIHNLDGNVQWETNWAILKSPAIVEYYAKYDVSSMPDISPAFRNLIMSHKKIYKKYRSSPIKNWEFDSTHKGIISGSYIGTLILLTNRRVLSAGEGMVGASQGIKNRLVIGENTGGVAQFSSTCGYYLPNSKLIINLPRQLILIPGLKECVGYLPDYWLDTNEPLEEVLKWLDDPDIYQFKYSISFKKMMETLKISAVLPEDVKIIPPSPKVPDSLAIFSGKWYGLSDGILDHLLVVEKIINGKEVDAIYAWGVAYQWGINQPGWKRYKAQFQNKKLVLTEKDSKIKITYKINSDGTMEAIYERPGIYSRAELTKLDK